MPKCSFRLDHSANPLTQGRRPHSCDLITKAGSRSLGIVYQESILMKGA
jgi:hypothetical protein